MATAERVLEILDDVQVRAAASIKQQFIGGYIALGHQCGFDLTKGDVVLVHEADVPNAVMLIRDRDPVRIDSRVAEPGKCLFVDRKVAHLPQFGRLNA